MSVIRLAARQALRYARPSAAAPLVNAAASTSAAVWPCPQCCSRLQVRYASKKKTSKSTMKTSSQKRSSEEDDDEIRVESHPVPVLAKGKKARAAEMTPEDALEQFDLDKLEQSMDAAVEKLQRDMKLLVGRVGRLSPGALITRI